MDQRFGKDFLSSVRLQELLKWTAIIDAVGQCVTLAVWLGPPRPADQRLTLLAVAAIGLSIIYMLSGFFLWVTMIWFTGKYWPINKGTKLALVIIEILSFGWIFPPLIYFFAFRPYAKSTKAISTGEQAG